MHMTYFIFLLLFSFFSPSFHLFWVSYFCPRPLHISIFHISYALISSLYITFNCIQLFLFWFLLFFLQRSFLLPLLLLPLPFFSSYTQNISVCSLSFFNQHPKFVNALTRLKKNFRTNISFTLQFYVTPNPRYV